MGAVAKPGLVEGGRVPVADVVDGPGLPRTEISGTTSPELPFANCGWSEPMSGPAAIRAVRPPSGANNCGALVGFRPKMATLTPAGPCALSRAGAAGNAGAVPFPDWLFAAAAAGGVKSRRGRAPGVLSRESTPAVPGPRPASKAGAAGSAAAGLGVGAVGTVGGVKSRRGPANGLFKRASTPEFCFSFAARAGAVGNAVTGAGRGCALGGSGA